MARAISGAVAASLEPRCASISAAKSRFFPLRVALDTPDDDTADD